MVMVYTDPEMSQWVNGLVGDSGEVCSTNVDEMVFQCHQWYSNRFEGRGFKYELATCIKIGHVVNYAGPFRSAFRYLSTFGQHVKKCL